jgi:hypothetical protein
LGFLQNIKVYKRKGFKSCHKQHNVHQDKFIDHRSNKG